MKNNDLLYNEIRYIDIIKHWNEEWTGWDEAKWIVSQIPNSRNHLVGFDRVRAFTNNYLLEVAVADKMELRFNSDDHEVLHPGWGEPIPDFIDENGVSYELKSSYKLECAPAYSDYRWWGANIHLLYERSTHHLYIQTKDGFIDLGFLDVQELE